MRTIIFAGILCLGICCNAVKPAKSNGQRTPPHIGSLYDYIDQKVGAIPLSRAMRRVDHDVYRRLSRRTDSLARVFNNSHPPCGS